MREMLCKLMKELSCENETLLCFIYCDSKKKGKNK